MKTQLMNNVVKTLKTNMNLVPNMPNVLVSLALAPKTNVNNPKMKTKYISYHFKSYPIRYVAGIR